MCWNLRHEHDNLAPAQDPDKPSQYVMSFTMMFPHEGDTCFLAHCYPYRYSDMMEDLANIKADPVRSRCFSQKVLCESLAGNVVPIVTITSPNSVSDTKNKQGRN